MPPALRVTPGVMGETIILEQDPSILDLRDVVHVPEGDPHSYPGIYDAGRRRIMQSAYFRGPNAEDVAPPLVMNHRYGDIREMAPDDVYIYIGIIHYHIGHFLLSTISRLWSDVRARFPTAKFLFQGNRDTSFWFSVTYIRTIFAALDLSETDFVRFERPVRIRRLILPFPSFEEASFAHRAYARVCNKIGQRLAGNLIASPNDRPVYLSKTRLKGGVRRLVNEGEICDRLEREGVEIVFPETLSLQEQAAMWFNRPYICGITGSAFHLGVFAPGRNVLMMNYDAVTYSNFCLSDRVNGTDTFYVSPAEGTLQSLGPSQDRTDGIGFNENSMAADPVGIAEDMLRILDQRMRFKLSRSGVWISNDRHQWQADGDPPRSAGAGLINAAAGRPTRQSSLHPFIPDQSINATSGFLTGAFQFHTDEEDHPWWEVDLEGVHEVRQIVIYNRCDVAQDRCERFRIDISVDRQSYETAHEQDLPLLFGGLSG